MVNGKTPLYLTVLAAVLLGSAVLLLQPYSADFPGTAYAKPVRRYLQAAIRQDSVSLSRLSASAAPVAWALDAARIRPDSLAAWAGRTSARTGVRRGDTTDVLVFPDGEPCSHAPIVLRFVGTGDDARVAKASSACFDRGR
jgi:hypothetical protein